VRSRPSPASTSTPALPGFRVLGASKSNDSDAKGPASISGSFPSRLRMSALLDQRAFLRNQRPCKSFERVQMIPIAPSTMHKPRALTRYLNAFKRRRAVTASKQVTWPASRVHDCLAGQNRVSPRNSKEVSRNSLFAGPACSRGNATSFLPFERVQMSRFRASPSALSKPVHTQEAP
jgi:hypothetical protein